MANEKMTRLRADVTPRFKSDFMSVAYSQGYKTESGAIRSILLDWMIKKRTPQELVNARLLEGEKNAHIKVFGAVQYNEDGSVKNVFNIMY